MSINYHIWKCTLHPENVTPCHHQQWVPSPNFHWVFCYFIAIFYLDKHKLPYLEISEFSSYDHPASKSMWPGFSFTFSSLISLSSVVDMLHSQSVWTGQDNNNQTAKEKRDEEMSQHYLPYRICKYWMYPKMTYFASRLPLVLKVAR